MPECLSTPDFLARARELPVIDVRSPSEFALGHIPGAVSVPLFSDEERADIGTTYKQVGRQPAVKLGLRRIGPRLEAFADELLTHSAKAGNQALVHCWRGGMRSGSVAWLLESFGCRVATLKGGYKAFRNWVLDGFEQPRSIHVVTGLTGSGKTEVLTELAAQGEQVIDLEGLAHHKGSSFGALGQKPAPTQQQFENRLVFEWRAADSDKPLWLEDESRTIGKIRLPLELWQQKKAGHFHLIEVPDEDRVKHLCDGYASHPPERLAERVEAIRKRLGGDRVKEAVEAIEAGDTTTACRIVLAYYDKAYRHSLKRAAPGHLTAHRFDRLDPAQIASTLAAAVR